MNANPVRLGPYPSQDSLHVLVNTGQGRILNSCKNGFDAISRHNAFVDYCLALLFSATGHRPVQDPFESLSQFDFEAGLVLISDKVVIEERAWRLVALPELAVHQTEAYRIHLANLVHYLARDMRNVGLANRVHRLASDNAPDLPLFFYLEHTEKGVAFVHVSPASVSARWGEYWPFPLSVLRHVHATGLLEKSERADWVEIQLGHVNGVDHPFGRTGDRSPLTLLSEIRTCMQGVLLDMGWKCVAPPMRRPPTSVFRLREGMPSGSRLLCHQERAFEREKRRGPIRVLVRTVLEEATREKALREFDAEEFQNFILSLINRLVNSGYSSNFGVRLIYRLIRRQRGGQQLLRRASRIREIDPEPSPFAEDSLIQYRNLRHLRLAFWAYLDQRGSDGGEIVSEIRLAEITISAALFGGLASAQRLQALGENIVNSTYKLRGQVFVDIPLTGDAGGPVYRWHPDPTSKSLIIGLPVGKRGGGRNSWKPLKKEIDHILQQLDESAKLSFRDIAKLSDAGLCVEAPGYLRAVLTGNVPAVSLPLAQYVRVVTDSVLQTEVKGEVGPEGIRGGWLPDTRRARRSANAAEPDEFVRRFGKVMADCRKMPVKGHIYPSKKSKRCLVNLIQQEFGNPALWSSAALLLAAWAVHLCRFGTRFHKKIQFSTVTRYVLMVAKPVLRRSKNEDFLSLPDVVYEDFYISALDWVGPRRRPAMAGRLEEFHKFLVEQYAIEDLDWGVIWQAAGSEPKVTYADANLLTEQEYRRTLACVNGDTLLPERLRIQYCALLFFGFRFGLRFGESWRLLVRDLHYEPGQQAVGLVVSSSIFGEVKTEAGQRYVFAMESLQPEERQVLDHLVADGQQAFRADGLAPLFSEVSGSRTLIDRAQTTWYLHAVMRSVTGDPSIRYHHLRHGWATRMFVFQNSFACAKTSLDTNVRAFAPSSIDASDWADFIGRYPLRAIATAMGHAHETTTIASYVHCADRLEGALPLYDVEGLENRISDYAWAYCLRVAYATIRSRRRRRANGESLFDSALRKASSIPCPSVISAPPRETCPELHGYMAHRTMELIDLDALLTLYAGGVRTAPSVAQSLVIRPSEGQALLERAAEIERNSGYTRYGVERGTNDPILAEGAERLPQSAFAATETNRVRDAVRSLSRRVGIWEEGKKKELANGLEAWVRTYEPQTKVHIITSRLDLDALQRMYRLCFGPGVRIVLRFWEPLSATLTLDLRSNGYTLHPDPPGSRRPRERSAIRNCAVMEASVTGFDTSISTLGTVHRIVYLLAVWGMERFVDDVDHQVESSSAS